MIPFILTIVGGYLIGDSMKDSKMFASGGIMADLVGKRVKLIEMREDPSPIAPGTMGTIAHVGGGVINVNWDNGRKLGLVEGVDEYEIIDTMAYGGTPGQRLADNANWTNEELLAQYNSFKIDLEDLKEGKITPRKIIGGGYKSSSVAKRVAKEYLEERITEYARALKIRGVMADGGIMAKGGVIKMGEYKIVIKKADGQSNYNVSASLFRNGDKTPLIGTTFKDTATNTEIKEWFEKRIGMMADGGKTGQTDFMKLYNLASEKQRLRNSLHNASPDRKKEILKKIDEVNAKMDQMGKSMGYADGGSIAEGNNQMLMSKIKEVKHHADELGHIVKPKTEVEAWVVAKAERSASDLSDITHYIDGNKK